MEQQAFYIIIAGTGMVIIVGIVFWAVTYSSRNEYDDHYRPHGGYPPPYYPPYPQHYPPPYSPQQRGMSFSDLLSVVLLVLFSFMMLQQCEKRDRPEHVEPLGNDQEEVIATDEVGGELSVDMGTGNPPGRESLDPANAYEDVTTVNGPSALPPLALSARYFFQTSASGDRSQILKEAQALNAISPGNIYIGIVDDGTGYPYKLLIGPYDTEEAAQSAHGWNIIVYRPEDKGVELCNPR